MKNGRRRAARVAATALLASAASADGTDRYDESRKRQSGRNQTRQDILYTRRFADHRRRVRRIRRRLAHLETTADVGLHTAQALILTIATAEMIRAPLGRARPRVANDSLTNSFNAFIFKFGGGFTEFDHRAYPSMHSAVAFATAAALVGEVRVRKPSAVKVAAPLLYTAAALIPGITRIYPQTAGFHG
jgi:hypothetical protein